MAFVAAHNILSPLGSTSAATFEAVVAGRTGVAAHPGPFSNEGPVWVAKLPAAWADDADLQQAGRYSKFEKLLMASIADALARCAVDPASPRTLFVFSTTKGNVSLLENARPDDAALIQRASLSCSAQLVSRYFGSVNQPVVISNACISGVAAVIYAQRVLKTGAYDAVIVAGADTVSDFVVSGFQAFQALSAAPCKPFSADRNGINLGEAAATLILTAAEGEVQVAGGAMSNDANHISGPSRTGAELALAISQAMRAAQVSAPEIGFVSAHGTATIYNDEMEAKAFTLTGLQHQPVNSVKGALGHTLGAAGLVESALSILSLTQGQSIPTAGYSTPMPAANLNIATASGPSSARWALKTASGFGGCNAALLLKRQ